MEITRKTCGKTWVKPRVTLEKTQKNLRITPARPRLRLVEANHFSFTRTLNSFLKEKQESDDIAFLSKTF